LKRLFFGSTSVFAIRSGSAAFNGASFITVYKERTQYPIRIVGIQFAIDTSAFGEWRMTVNGEKVFPFSDINSMDSEFHNLMPIEIAAGEFLQIEVKSRNSDYKGIVILQELDVVEIL
jgi:hypothetical protein